MSRTIALSDDQAARLLDLSRDEGLSATARQQNAAQRGYEALARQHNFDAALWRVIARQLERAD